MPERAEMGCVRGREGGDGERAGREGKKKAREEARKEEERARGGAGGSKRERGGRERREGGGMRLGEGGRKRGERRLRESAKKKGRDGKTVGGRRSCCPDSADQASTISHVSLSLFLILLSRPPPSLSSLSYLPPQVGMRENGRRKGGRDKGPERRLWPLPQP